MARTNWDEALKFFTPLERTNRIHQNFIFRFQYCGLSDDKAAKSVGVDISQVYKWDDGEPIPFSVRRVWLFESGRVIPSFTGFEDWSFKGGRIVTPCGASYTHRQLSVALYLLDMESS